MQQLIPNQGKTGANGGPKWRQIWKFQKIIFFLKKMRFLQIENFFSQKFIEW